MKVNDVIEEVDEDKHNNNSTNKIINFNSKDLAKNDEHKINFLQNDKISSKAGININYLNELNTVRNKISSISNGCKNKISELQSLNQNNSNKNKFIDFNCFKNSTRRINYHNITEQKIKNRVGLFSANSPANSNTILPLLGMRRPMSNLDFGGGQLLNFEIKSSKNEINKKNENKDINNINGKNEKKERNNIHKSKNLFKSFDFKKRDFNSLTLNELRYCNNNVVPKMHQIKIEKGMMTNKFANLLNIQLFEYCKFSNQIAKNDKSQIKNGKKSLSLLKYKSSSSRKFQF